MSAAVGGNGVGVARKATRTGRRCGARSSHRWAVSSEGVGPRVRPRPAVSPRRRQAPAVGGSTLVYGPRGQSRLDCRFGCRVWVEWWNILTSGTVDGTETEASLGSGSTVSSPRPGVVLGRDLVPCEQDTTRLGGRRHEGIVGVHPAPRSGVGRLGTLGSTYTHRFTPRAPPRSKVPV